MQQSACIREKKLQAIIMKFQRQSSLIVFIVWYHVLSEGNIQSTEVFKQGNGWGMDMDMDN
jgi:hypothetical protein